MKESRHAVVESKHACVCKFTTGCLHVKLYTVDREMFAVKKISPLGHVAKI